MRWYDRWSKFFWYTLAGVAVFFVSQWGYGTQVGNLEPLFNRGTLTIIALTLLVAGLVTLIAVCARSAASQSSSAWLWGAGAVLVALITLCVIIEMFAGTPTFLVQMLPFLGHLPAVPVYPWGYFWDNWTITLPYLLSLIAAGWLVTRGSRRG